MVAETKMPAQLEAGGYVRLETEVDHELREPLVARGYSAGTLGSRKVVRLTKDGEIVADDLVAQFLMFERVGEPRTVAWQARTTPPFLEQALTRFPDHARQVLELARAMQAAARRAALKPGNAWKTFQTLSSVLDGGLLPLLPLYWEEVAYIYADLPSPTYAAQAVGKSLEAEETHALELEPTSRRKSMIEFAARGCLSGKAIRTYARVLQKKYGPTEAFRAFADLFLRRTLLGAPPTVDLAKDLVRLAKDSELDADREVEDLLAKLLPCPALARAPIRFWKQLDAPIRRMLKRDSSTACWLLQQTRPDCRRDADEYLPQWLTLLRKWKVIDVLCDPSPLDESILPGGRAEWIARLTTGSWPVDGDLFDIIEQMADALRAERRPVPLIKTALQNHHDVDADVLETLLELGIDIDSPSDQSDGNFIDLEDWLHAEPDHPRRHSALTHVGNDPRFRPLLLRAFGECLTQGTCGAFTASGIHSLADNIAHSDVLIGMWWEWLEAELECLQSHPAADAQEATDRLTANVQEGALQQFPQLADRLAAIDWPALLQRTLRLGVLDEYGWPALDEAHAAVPLPVGSKHKLGELNWVFPFVAYSNGTSLVTVGPLHADLSKELPPSNGAIRSLFPVLDDVLVSVWDPSAYQTTVYWLSNPDQPVSYQSPSYYCEMQVPCQDGAFIGARVIRPGDKTIPKGQRLLHDGERFWCVHVKEAWEDDQHRTGPIEVDPLTGRKIGDQPPDWFSRPIPPGGSISWSQSYLLLLPSGFSDSPLGSQDGLIGWRAICLPGGDTIGERIDGKQVRTHVTRRYRSWVANPVAIVNQPCGEGTWTVLQDNTVVETESGHGFARIQSVAEGDRMGYACLPNAACPPMFFHLMTLRHEPTSRKLRCLEKDVATTLIDAALADQELLGEQEKTGNAFQTALQEVWDDFYGDDAADDKTGQPPVPMAALEATRRLFPDAPPALQEGIAAVTNLVAWLQCRINTALSNANGDPQSEPTDEAEEWQLESVDEGIELLAEAAAGSSRLQVYIDSVGKTRDGRRLVDVLSGQTAASPLQTTLTWIYSLADLPSAAWYGFWKAIATSDAAQPLSERVQGDWLTALKWIRQTGLFDLPGTVRAYLARPGDKQSAHLEQLSEKEELWVWQDDSTVYLAEAVTCLPSWDTQALIVAYNRDGEPTPPDGFEVIEHRDIARDWQGEQIDQFIDAVTRATELPLPPRQLLEETAEQLGVAPVQLGLGWLGNIRTGNEKRESLSRELRSHFGWKVKDLTAAAATLDGGTVPAAVFGAPVRSDPTLPFTNELPAAMQALAQAWQPHVTAEDSIPSEFTNQLTKLLYSVDEFREYFDAGVRSKKWKASGFRFVCDEDTWHEVVAKFDDRDAAYCHLTLCQLPELIKFTNYRLPFGHSLRRQLPAVLGHFRAFLSDPQTVISLEEELNDLEIHPDKVPSALSRVLGKPTAEQPITIYDDGAIIAGWVVPSLSLLFRPAALDQDAIDRLTALLSSIQPGRKPRTVELKLIDAVTELRSDAMARLAEHNQSDALPRDHWDQDPRASVPQLVAEVAAARDLSEDAAAYYLALLALPDPTNTNIRTWFAWSTGALKKSTKELKERELVLEAKRSRAGRSVFLPGAWVPLRSPNLPLERWKLPLYGLGENNNSLPLILPACPVGELFERAWQRVQSGDEPA